MQIPLAPNATLFHADCRDALRSLPSDSVDAVVTDPPYELNFMGKGWDNTGIANDPALWAEVFRVLKPGGHCAAFSASRTYHRMACAIEDAGFEIRDSLMWVYGTGFPKSLDVSKAVDKIIHRVGMFEDFAHHYAARRAALGLTHNAICEVGKFYAEHNHGGASTNWEKGHNVPTVAQWIVLQPLLGLSDEWLPLIERIEAEREVVGKHDGPAAASVWMQNYGQGTAGAAGDITISGTAAAREWDGWGTALKPAFEPIVLARKPLSEGTVAANVLKWRTGALNIDASRIHTAGSEAKAYTVNRLKPGATLRTEGGTWKQNGDDAATYEGMTKDGRWPANVVTDGSDEVVRAFPVAGGQQSRARAGGEKAGSIYGHFASNETRLPEPRGDSGSAARFFYSAKASKADRNGSKHPTVKPISLMEWLCTLITPPGGTILDPFAGSGTTGAAATRKGFSVLLCEREAEYVRDIRARFALPKARLVIPDPSRELALLPRLAALRSRLAVRA